MTRTFVNPFYVDDTKRHLTLIFLFIMKSKTLVILFMGVFTLTSCDSDNEKDTKDPEQETAKLAMYEPAVRVWYLETMQASLTAKRDSLEMGSDKYVAVQEEIDGVTKRISYVTEQFLGKITPVEYVGKNLAGPLTGITIKPVPLPTPLPIPIPSPCNCTIPWGDVEILVPEEIKEFNLTIKNSETGKIIGGFSKENQEPMRITEAGSAFRSYTLGIEGSFDGEVIVEFSVFSDFTGQMEAYQIKSRL